MPKVSIVITCYNLGEYLEEALSSVRPHLRVDGGDVQLIILSTQLIPAEAKPEGLAQKELATRLQYALDALPFDQRSVVVLREVDGLSYEEIAFSLGVAVGTVKSRLTRARQTLRVGLLEARTP